MGALKEHGMAGTFALAKEKIHKILPLGYSCAGQVIAVGSKVEKFRIGDYVACAGASFANHADMVSVPQNLVVLVKDPTILKQASLSAIGAIALQGIRRAQLQLGETVCVVGLGLIGQITMQLAKQSGCRVIGVDIQESRLMLAKKSGIVSCYNPLTTNVIREIEFATGHHGADATIITAASESGTIIQQAMLATRRKGRVILVGDVKIEFDRDPFYAKEIDFLISCSYGPGRYDPAYEQHGVDYPYSYVRWTENRNMAYFIELLEKKQLTVDPLVSREFSIHNAVNAYESLKKDNVLGIVLSYYVPGVSDSVADSGGVKADDFDEPTKVRPYLHQQRTLNTCVIGVGGFCKVKILPIISKIKTAAMHSIIDVDTPTALSTAKAYKAQRVSNDFRKILNDDDIKVVVIATPHSYHTEQALACLKTGKAVLVEKPASVNFNQFYELKKFFAEHKNSLYCVDFNRSSSPFMREIKDVVKHRTNPLFITYRMNANYLSKDHWIQTESHRGRIIGEACHIFELFCYLTDAKPVSIVVNPLNSTTDDLLITDNVIATISMSDGSCCSLAYTSLGDAAIGKEYMEIFFDGKTIVMNDFLELRGYGLPKHFNKHTKTQRKGHEELFTQFFKAAQSADEPSPVPIERILMATEISLVVDKLARNGGGAECLNYW